MKLISSIVCATALLLSPAGHALTLAPYSPETLATAQAAGQPVALHFHADWCPTCKAQDKALESLKTDGNLDLTVLAGGLTTLSPCVFPPLPLVLGGAMQASRAAPLAHWVMHSA